MFIVDDPMLALITRFVVGPDEPDIPAEQFSRDQIAAIQRYVEGFPARERNARALEWVERHAERYRREWQQRAVSALAGTSRCPDCPLRREDGAGQCRIHQRWRDLLLCYLDGALSTGEYVDRALALLSAHKERLKVTCR